MTDFRGKVVLITGGSSGIGYALASVFAAKGAQVVIAARDAAKLQQAVATLKLAGWSVTGLVADVTHQEEAEDLIRKIQEQFGQLDILVNNAGISMRASFKRLDLSVLEKLFAVNFWGVVFCTKAALPFLLQTRGQIVNVSSIAGLRPLPGRTGYSASKAAMQAFMDALRVELRGTGVHVMTVYPGYTASNIRNTALGPDGIPQSENPLDEAKLMPAEQVATLIVAGLEKRKRDLLIGTQGKLTVFLNKWFPKFMDGVVHKFMQREGPLD